MVTVVTWHVRGGVAGDVLTQIFAGLVELNPPFLRCSDQLRRQILALLRCFPGHGVEGACFPGHGVEARHAPAWPPGTPKYEIESRCPGFSRVPAGSAMRVVGFSSLNGRWPLGGLR